MTPRLSGLAALGLAALILGAITTNLLIIDEAVPVPVTYLVLAAGVAWGRWPQTRALAAVLRR